MPYLVDGAHAASPDQPYDIVFFNGFHFIPQ